MHRAYLSLGSNLGDRLASLAAAVRALGDVEGVDVIGVSNVYETAALGANGALVEDQPAYLNCAISADVRIEPAALRARTSDIERAMGRGVHGRWESRVIDIDLVLFGAMRITTPSLTLPHPRMFERAFVLRPLVDLDPDLAVPGVGKLAELLDSVRGQPCEIHTSGDSFRALISEH